MEVAVSPIIEPVDSRTGLPRLYELKIVKVSVTQKLLHKCWFLFTNKVGGTPVSFRSENGVCMWYQQVYNDLNILDHARGREAD